MRDLYAGECKCRVEPIVKGEKKLQWSPGGGRVGGLSTVWRIEKSPRGEETIKKNGKRCGVLKSRDKSDRRSPLLRPEIGPPGKSKVGRDKGERTKGN